MHQTKDLDDGYMGSGKLLKRAIKKYGIDNFVKEILFVFDEEWKMKLAEKILVVIDPEASYNICPGGHGGWGYLNDFSENHIKRCRKAGKAASRKEALDKIRWLSKNDENWKKKHKLNSSKGGIACYQKYGKGTFRDKKHTEDTKEKMSAKHKERLSDPTKNSQYGTMWITNGSENQKVKKEIDEMPEGWYKGRTLVMK